tara:strand:+ start:186 stop:407 length:222 start_codon:yes stop_codon:yes gene_type:complete
MYLEIFRILLTGLVMGGLALLFDNYIYYYVAGTYSLVYYFWLAKLKRELINVSPAAPKVIQETIQSTVHPSKT